MRYTRALWWNAATPVFPSAAEGPYVRSLYIRVARRIVKPVAPGRARHH